MIASLVLISIFPCRRCDICSSFAIRKRTESQRNYLTNVLWWQSVFYGMSILSCNLAQGTRSDSWTLKCSYCIATSQRCTSVAQKILTVVSRRTKFSGKQTILHIHWIKIFFHLVSFAATNNELREYIRFSLHFSKNSASTICRAHQLTAVEVNYGSFIRLKTHFSHFKQINIFLCSSLSVSSQF